MIWPFLFSHHLDSAPLHLYNRSPVAISWQHQLIPEIKPDQKFTSGNILHVSESNFGKEIPFEYVLSG